MLPAAFFIALLNTILLNLIIKNLFYKRILYEKFRYLHQNIQIKQVKKWVMGKILYTRFIIMIVQTTAQKLCDLLIFDLLCNVTTAYDFSSCCLYYFSDV